MTQYFEDLESGSQKLTFNTVKETIWKGGKLETMLPSMETASGRYNNFAYLMSDQCPWHFILNTPDSYHVLTGPMPIQLVKCMDLIKEWDRPFSTHHSLEPVISYPKVAIRESLVNALIHFDPSRMENIKIHINKDNLVVESPGGVLYRHLDGQLSNCARNRKMADLMMRMGFAFLKGTGLKRMRNSYFGTGAIPMTCRRDDSFKVTLPSLRTWIPYSDERFIDVIEHLRRRPGISFRDLSSISMISPHVLDKMIASMEDEGSVVSFGIGSKKVLFLCRPTDQIAMRTAS